MLSILIVSVVIAAVSFVLGLACYINVPKAQDDFARIGFFTGMIIFSFVAAFSFLIAALSGLVMVFMPMWMPGWHMPMMWPY